MTGVLHSLFSGSRLTHLLFATAMAVGMPAAVADEGHNHDHDKPAAAGTASPRVEAHSDLFELVGIVDKGQMTVYLDRYTTNEPVLGAKIEYESGTNKGVAAPQTDGTYLIKFDGLAKPGELPFAFTVSAGSDTDLLAGDLDLKDSHDHSAEGSRNWLRWLAYTLAAALTLAMALFLTRKYKNTRRARLNG
jgi:cobalt-zinc-cadmium efflux system membrane fusion protein